MELAISVFTGSGGFTSAVTTGAVVVGGVAGVTVQSAFIVAPLGVVDEVTGAGGGVGACVCSACGVTLVPTAGLSPDAICDCTFALLASNCATLAFVVGETGVIAFFASTVVAVGHNSFLFAIISCIVGIIQRVKI